MAKHRYIITWPLMHGSGECRVSLLLESTEVAKAINGDAKDAPVRLMICEEVRRLGSLKRRELSIQPVFFQHLTILLDPNSTITP